MPKTIKQLLEYAKHELLAAQIESFAIDAQLLLMQVLKFSREDILRQADKLINLEQEDKYISLIERRKKHEPIAYILEKKEFFSQEFRVNKNVLIPRPDSETIIEAVIDHYNKDDKGLKILDLGTGSGCLLLTLLNEIDSSTGVGVDISQDAIAIARENAFKLDLAKRAEFRIVNWSGFEYNGVFDIIVSNPPYISLSDIADLDPDVRSFEPLQALDGGKDGLDCYRQLAPLIKKKLITKGKAFLECGLGQHEDVVMIMAEHGLKFVEFRKDLSGINRCVVVAN